MEQSKPGGGSRVVAFILGGLVVAVLIAAVLLLGRGHGRIEDIPPVTVDAPRLPDINMPDAPKLPKG